MHRAISRLIGITSIAMLVVLPIVDAPAMVLAPSVAYAFSPSRVVDGRQAAIMHVNDSDVAQLTPTANPRAQLTRGSTRPRGPSSSSRGGRGSGRTSRPARHGRCSRNGSPPRIPVRRGSVCGECETDLPAHPHRPRPQAAWMLFLRPQDGGDTRSDARARDGHASKAEEKH
jgi:hypothetical protein